MPQNIPKVLGHRGEMMPEHIETIHVQENGLHAIERGLKFSDGVECDICKTKDGELVVIHDAKCVLDQVEYCFTDNLCPQSANIVGERTLDEMDFSEVSTLRLKSGEKIPLLKEVFDLYEKYPGKRMNLELKGPNLALDVLEKVHQRIADNKMTVDQFLILSFDHYQIYEIRKHDHLGIKLGLTFLRSESPALTPMYPWLTEGSTSGAYSCFSAESLKSDIVKKVNPDSIIIPEPAFTKENIDIVQQHFPKAKTAVWVFSEVQNDASTNFNYTIASLKGRINAIDSIMIDDPENTTEALKNTLRSAL